MTFAIVNVLPEPVTPISTCSRRPLAQALDQARDRLRLIAGGLERGLELKLHQVSEGSAVGFRLAGDVFLVGQWE